MIKDFIYLDEIPGACDCVSDISDDDVCVTALPTV
jgi:hypothetical protein